jgi:hypothetical protein
MDRRYPRNGLNDLKNGEWIFIRRPNKVLDNTNAISAKLGDGEHTAGSSMNDY